MEGILVHGGAWNIPPDLHDHHLKGCKKAAALGFDYLDDAIQAVVEAISYMEDDQTFDAGIGSFLTEKGEVEMDAIVTSNTNFGSVLSVQHIKNPVRVAQAIYHEDSFSILTGEGADNYAKEKGFELADNSYFKIQREIHRWHNLSQKPFNPRDAFTFSTVGAVACDHEGRIAVALSTGGAPLKKKGRVGDTPIPGAGAYATLESGAASTGHGESILRFLLAKRTCDEMNAQNPMQASQYCIDELTKMDGYGGVICINKKGEPGYAYNTPYMAIAYRGKYTKFAMI
jgi:beta-aspartyl-peptidase (threonine type)